MIDDATSPTKCALCRGSTDDDLRFCSGCATRAGESILRQSTLGSTLAAANVAVDYLGYLYKGKSGDVDLDLVMLAVTAAGELRTARHELCRLRQEISDLRTSINKTPDLADLVNFQSIPVDRELAALVNSPSSPRRPERIDQIVVGLDGQGQSETLECRKQGAGVYRISRKDHGQLKTINVTVIVKVIISSPWSDEIVQVPISRCERADEHHCEDPDVACSNVTRLEETPAWIAMVLVESLREMELLVRMIHTPEIQGVSSESCQEELEAARKKQQDGICSQDAGFSLVVFSKQDVE